MNESYGEKFEGLKKELLLIDTYQRSLSGRDNPININNIFFDKFKLIIESEDRKEIIKQQLKSLRDEINTNGCEIEFNPSLQIMPNGEVFVLHNLYSICDEKNLCLNCKSLIKQIDEVLE